jgi:hypothetical protein
VFPGAYFRYHSFPRAFGHLLAVDQSG